MNDFTRQDEIFDIVDVNDQVIGSSTRGEIHAQGLNHRAVHILIYNSAGQFFLQLRSATKDRFPNCWDCSCSGHVDSGEDYSTAAWRELGEELGYVNQMLPLRPLVKLPAGVATGHEFIQLYLLGPTEGPFQINPDELADARFFSLPEVDNLVFNRTSETAGPFGAWWPTYRESVLKLLSV